MKTFFLTSLLVTGFFQTVNSGTLAYDPHPVFLGTYTVPTNQDLASYATWKLKEVKLVKNDQTISVKYTMPEDLLESQEVSMKGKVKSGAPFFFMTGDRVQAACSEMGPDSYVCLLKFKKASNKFQEKEEHFKQLYSDSGEAHKRILVARSFAVDPIGILRIEKQ